MCSFFVKCPNQYENFLIGLPDVNHDGYFVKKPVFAFTYNVTIVLNVCILINKRYSKFNRWMPLEMSYKF